MDEIVHEWRFQNLQCIVRLPDQVLLQMKSLASDFYPHETGGTLVGHYSKDKTTAHIEQALGVGKGGRRGRTWFYRPPDRIDEQLMDIYRESDGKTYYLGEWHTHPGASQRPSGQDKRTLKMLASSPSVATDTPILIILGGDVRANPSLLCMLVDANGYLVQGISSE